MNTNVSVARDRLIAAGIPQNMIQMPHGVYPHIMVNGWTVELWATQKDLWQVTPPSTSSHAGFPSNLTARQVAEIVRQPPPIMRGLRLNDGSTTG